MSVKINSELQKIIDSKSISEEIPVIIVFKNTPDIKELESKGIRVSNQFEQINGVSGTAKCDAIISLSEQNDVVTIDFDGESEAHE